ncbi:SAM-dependent methyltransferase [Pseudoalteromonas luteoviolacea]|uniref:SAM-dependent methyltransferase n=1 Tax=Pseudoalteromonas luteoviolacea TaxID=43657 RepID=UPI001B3823B5|nr:class I SAM-dependent methyltransferase [Pseudoalteromonas luteoviolacea]MBQ4837820.1 class I SAM-dependent methyltransferase [Pseudoalteromonas luteoviolacea]
MEYNSPLGSAKEKHLISLLQLPKGSSVLEIGCGNGRLLHKILEAYESCVVGIDIDATLIQKASAFASSRFNTDRFQFVCDDISNVEVSNGSYDLIVCNGASHAYGNLSCALGTMARFLKPNGRMLLGECFWIQRPDTAYLNFLGVPENFYLSHFTTVKVAQAHGFQALYATTSSVEEWDNFEWGRVMQAQAALKDCPNDADIQAKIEQLNTWMDAYLRWGRETLGYGFYLFEKKTKF